MVKYTNREYPRVLAPQASQDNFEGLHWKNGILTSKDEYNVRDALGEHVCPKMMLALLSTFPGGKTKTSVKGGKKIAK